MTNDQWLEEIKWTSDGLVPAIAQEATSGRVLMVAWMNREALLETVKTGRGVYWSRSRAKLWRKGEESGNAQEISEIRLDCDNDVVLLKVTQLGHEPGIACHTGRHSCFYQSLQGETWQAVEPVLEDRVDVSVRADADGERSPTGRFEPLGAVVASQPQDAQDGPIALLGMGTRLDDAGRHLSNRGTQGAGALDQLARRRATMTLMCL